MSQINRTAPGFTDQHPELPWAQMRAMRNVVLHHYFAVGLKILWTTVAEDLPRLKGQVDRLLLQQPRRDPDRSR